MNPRTTADDTLCSAAPKAAPRPVVWVELPAPGTDTSSMARDTWYDPAALYEEPERWDGMA